MDKLFQSKYTSFLLAVVVIVLTLAAVRVKNQKAETLKEAEGLRTKIEGVRKNNDSLQKFLSYFNNSSFLKREARIRLNYKEADEEVVLVYRDLNNKDSLAAVNKPAELPFWKRWWNYLRGR